MDGQTGLDRRTFFKGAGLVGASLAVPSLLAGCGGDGAGATGAQKLEFWWNPSVESADQMTAWMNGVIKEFTAANKGTSIESTTQPSEQLASNFRTACQSKSGSDLQHEYSGPYTMQFVWEKCIAPLDGTLDAEDDEARPAPAGPRHLQVPGEDMGASLVQRSHPTDVQQGALQEGRA